MHFPLVDQLKMIEVNTSPLTRLVVDDSQEDRTVHPRVKVDFSFLKRFVFAADHFEKHLFGLSIDDFKTRRFLIATSQQETCLGLVDHKGRAFQGSLGDIPGDLGRTKPVLAFLAHFLITNSRRINRLSKEGRSGPSPAT